MLPPHAASIGIKSTLSSRWECFFLSFLATFAIMQSAMNTTPTHFLYYDHEEEQWRPTSLQELAAINDPEMFVIPVYENGEQGEQCTWQNWPETHQAYIRKKRGPIKMLMCYSPFSGWRKTTFAEMDSRESNDSLVKFLHTNGDFSEQIAWGDWCNTEEAQAYAQKENKEQQEKKKREKEEASIKKKATENIAQQEIATNIAIMAKLMKELYKDQVETNLKVRCVCIILLISWAIGAIGIILGFIIPNFLGNDSKSEPVTPPTPPSYYLHR